MTHTDLKPGVMAAAWQAWKREYGQHPPSADALEMALRAGIAVQNTRTPDTAPSQCGDLIAAEAHFGANILRDEGYPDTAKAIDAVVTALRAAEAENAELTAFRNSYKDTIRRLQDSVSAAEAREQKLRKHLETVLDEAEDVFVCMADATGIDRHNMPKPFIAARRALGGDNG